MNMTHFVCLTVLLSTPVELNEYSMLEIDENVSSYIVLL